MGIRERAKCKAQNLMLVSKHIEEVLFLAA